MRADRLLSILLLLQARGRVTGRELATQLEVSARTVHRDLEALGAAGVPVLALRGSRGGWELSEGWRTQVPGLDDAELRALLMAQPRVIGDRPLAAAAERALAKLMAAMPEPQRKRAASMRQRLYVDPIGWRGTTENLSMLPVVQDAVTHDRKLSMRYRSAGKSPGSGSVWLCAPLGTLACQRERHEATGSQRHCGTDAQKCWSLPSFPFKDRARMLRPEDRSREPLHAHEGS